MRPFKASLALWIVSLSATWLPAHQFSALGPCTLTPSSTSPIASGSKAVRATTSRAVLGQRRPGVLELRAKSDDQGPYPLGTYDPDTANEYFSRNKGVVIKRAFELLTLGGGLALAEWWDEKTGTVLDNQELRAEQLVEVVTELGPTFIKIGQSLSIRSDILPAAYVKALQRLQDRVPPFENEDAVNIIEAELGLGSRGLKNLFIEFSEGPVAAASLGQVYKGKLKNGAEVAIKVQRPDVLETIACDLYLLRLAEPILEQFEVFSGVASIKGVIDEWGIGFVNELDYRREAENGMKFIQSMQDCGLNSVIAPEVIAKCSSERVLTTKWIEGISLARVDTQDTGRLCALALNAYLTMMLDTGILHCDPHPGNLLRTTDGKLCILDWGLVTTVNEDLQYALVDYIAHLTTTDYSSIPGDLIALGFVPPGREDDVRRAGVVEVLSEVLDELSSGGGLAAIDVDKVVEKLVGLSRQYGTLFQVPSYFAYIIRAFTVLEGIGLSLDPKYSILKETTPYLAKRLVTDSSPRTQMALKEMLYGSASSKSLNTSRLANLASGFSEFTATTSVAESDTNEALTEALNLLFSPEGNYLQDLLLEELAKLLEAGSRGLVSSAFRTPAGRIATYGLRQQEQIADRLGPAGNLLFPAAAVYKNVKGFVELTEEDQEALKTARELIQLATPLVRNGSSSSVSTTMRISELRALFVELGPQLQELGPGANAALRRLVQILQKRAGDRVSKQTLQGAAEALESPPRRSSAGRTILPAPRSNFWEDRTDRKA